VLEQRNRKWWTLGAVALGLFMIMLDNTIVNVALPSMQRDLGISVSELEWIVSGYALTFAVLLLTGGKLADLYGRRRIFVVGLAVFTISSLACGLAPSAAVLIGARVVQGVGAALMNPATLSIIVATFPPSERGRAIGIWVGVSAMALAIGPLVGGVITEHASWSWIFFINVPIGVLAMFAARVFIDESRDTSSQHRLDLPGLLSSAIALFALTFGLIEADRYGWTSGLILGLFAVAIVGFAVFVTLELRQGVPMLDLSLFRHGTFAGANTAMLLTAFAMFGMLFFLSLYVQDVLGYSATRAGAAFLPMTVMITLVAPIAGRLSDRVGSRWLMGGGLTLVGVALMLFSRLGVHSSYWMILPALIIAGLGISLTMTPTTAAVMASVPVDKAGVGSAVLNSFRQVGGSLGIAVIGAIVTSQIAVAPQSPQYAGQFVSGMHTGFHVSAAMAFIGAVVAVAAVRKYPYRPTEPVPEAV
jgi:EmrB/QacA subfamily drug resistance transporter